MFSVSRFIVAVGVSAEINSPQDVFNLSKYFKRRENEGHDKDLAVL